MGATKMAKMMAMKAMKMASMKMGMKKMASMKMGMKKMAMKKSIIAKGRMAKYLVYKGSKVKTSGGLKKSALKKNKHGKIVSVKASANAAKGKSAKWANATKLAYKKLGLKKFTPVKKGTALYKAVMSLYK